MARPSTLLVSAVLAVLLPLAASADSFVMVHPGSECTETPHDAGGMYGSSLTGQEHIGYWNDGASLTVATVFCPIGMIANLNLEEYDWDSAHRVSQTPVRSMTGTFEQVSFARLKVWLTKNNHWSQRDYCWVDITYPSVTGEHWFDSLCSQVLHPVPGLNILEFDLSDIWSSHGYVTLVCKLSGVSDDTGLPSQIAGYTLEVVE